MEAIGKKWLITALSGWFFLTCVAGFSGQLGNWQSTSSLNVARSDNVAVLSRSTIVYTFGGYPFTNTPYPVERTTIRSNGTLSPWSIESISMASARGEAVGFATDTYIYAIGGYNTSSFLTTIERAPIQPNGTLGNWTIVGVTPASVIAQAGTAVYNNKFCYIIGGYPASSSLYKTTINTDGTLGTWTLLTSQLITGRRWLMSVVINTSLYVVGGEDSHGFNLLSIEKTSIYPNGDLSVFTTLNGTVAFHAIGGVFNDSSYLNIIGGYFGGDLSYRSERAKVNPDGSLGTWVPAPGLQNDRDFFGYVQTTTNTYVIGASEGGDSNSVEYAPILPPTGIDKKRWEIFE